ncbi:MAG TPA: TetR/AcrR family transcriptional regulator [Ktedonobacterales bacterium]|nr:TetR/AcrR family transcriptional regulator [Ktedonobacterales bacterium]
MSEPSRMRRQPKQARSQQRVDHLLNAAAQVFEEVGYAAATTNAIAAHAGVSIGSLYQFFPNKEAMMDALVKRYLDELQQVVFVREERLPITSRVGRVIDQLARFHESHAGFRALFLDANVEHRIQSVLIQLTESIIEQYFPTLDANLRRQTATIWLGITRGITQLTEPPHNLSESSARAETKLALLGYLRAVLVRAGVPLPEDMAQ